MLKPARFRAEPLTQTTVDMMEQLKQRHNTNSIHSMDDRGLRNKIVDTERVNRLLWETFHGLKHQLEIASIKKQQEQRRMVQVVSQLADMVLETESDGKEVQKEEEEVKEVKKKEVQVQKEVQKEDEEEMKEVQKEDEEEMKEVQKEDEEEMKEGEEVEEGQI